MGRPRKNPGYDSDIIQKEIIELVVQLHKKEYSYRNIAVELDLSVSKVGTTPERDSILTELFKRILR